jgi:hypothetical protein
VIFFERLADHPFGRRGEQSRRLRFRCQQLSKNLFFKSSCRVKRLDAEWKANQSPRVCQHLFDFLFEADSNRITHLKLIRCHQALRYQLNYLKFSIISALCFLSAVWESK